MKRVIALLACLLAFAACATAETILWEDDNGTVIIGDGGEVRFIDPDGVVTDLFTIEETPLPDAAETPVPAPYETVAPVEGFAFRRILRYGDSGDSVRALQQRLLDLGYSEARVSGG